MNLMFARDTDRDWTYFGDSNPYFGVLSHPEFRAENLTAAAVEQFYASGQEHVAAVMRRLQQLFGDTMRFRQIVDFGCGVGRLTIPFASHAVDVVGIDVSEGMLATGRERCALRGVDNVRFLVGNDSLSQLSGRPDMVHSYIVFQHIPVGRGMAILRTLVNRLAPGGMGVLHLTFGMAMQRADDGETIRWNRRKRLLKQILNRLPNLFMRPYMQMNDYSVADVLTAFHAVGITDFHVDFVEQAGHLGGVFYFRKPH